MTTDQDPLLLTCHSPSHSLTTHTPLTLHSHCTHSPSLTLSSSSTHPPLTLHSPSLTLHHQVCYRCNKSGHIARECSFTEDVCYSCTEPGTLPGHLFQVTEMVVEITQNNPSYHRSPFFGFLMQGSAEKPFLYIFCEKLQGRSSG